MPSPLGWLRLTASERALQSIEFEPNHPAPPDHAASPNHPTPPDQPNPPTPTNELADYHPLLSQAKQQLQEYFAGQRTVFSLPLEPIGTDFQQLVWRGLQNIGFGQTMAYRELAAHIQRPRAMRAVGGANGCNPLPIIIPCHRVIAANGNIGGYSAGLERKRWLLRHEGHNFDTI